MTTSTTISRTATHRPAARRRRFRHDDLVAVDLFSGFGGLTRGIEMAGFTTIMAANHNPYKVEVHEAKARRPICGVPHVRGAKNCANCLHWARQWRATVLAAATTPPTSRIGDGWAA
jgi:hypothetical protein